MFLSVNEVMNLLKTSSTPSGRKYHSDVTTMSLNC